VAACGASARGAVFSGARARRRALVLLPPKPFQVNADGVSNGYLPNFVTAFLAFFNALICIKNRDRPVQIAL